jgi:hypothetical protein
MPGVDDSREAGSPAGEINIKDQKAKARCRAVHARLRPSPLARDRATSERFIKTANSIGCPDHAATPIEIVKLIGLRQSDDH